jgi:chaperonin cofactor prefoldin
MDKELMELFEQKLFIFAKRDDVERLRQETGANFRKLVEENKGLILGWVEGIRAEIEGLKKEVKTGIDPLREDIGEELKKLEGKLRSALTESIQPIESSFRTIREEAGSSMNRAVEELGSGLRAIREETNSAIVRSREEMASNLQSIKEEGRATLLQSKEEGKAEWERLGEGVENLNGQVMKTMEEIASLNEKIKAGFNEVKEELGSMIKFSYADLEKRFTTLEARVKALEKLVLP